ncbi:glycosyltransferase family 4 protein [Cryobacterium sp. TMT2-42-4]|uniref:glycosyltransferase family 4 protein n=1 Tax=Cryobacterium sp. TMT2-42-4 TaxID=1259255 RepID=UPI00106CFA67|nr:glycosyltransferase family 4 protein [Cryobacterium sp. TMT2-42-4]TFC33949.1 glycosyltransferase [Cryobacterium sp. TMT2-42-4]
MKVAVIHSYYSSRQSSGENVVVDAQIRALRRHGIDVRVIAARTDELETLPGYKVRSAINVATGRGASPLDELERFAPDIVHVHNLFPNWGHEWLGKWGGPIVATVHNFRPVCAAGTLFRDGAHCTRCPDGNSLESVRHSCYRGSLIATLPLTIRNRHGLAGDRLLERADKVILLSGRSRKLYTGFGLSDEKVVVIPNFVEDIGFAPEADPGQSWVYVGRLSEEKGISNLLKNWPAGESLLVFGSGPLQAEVVAAEAESSNIVYGGQLNQEDLPEVLAGAKGFVFPSECAEGGIPLSYVEALAAGRSIVALAGSSAADDLKQSGSGAVFATWDGLQRALSEAVENPVLSGKLARSHYEKNFMRDVFLARTETLYSEMMSENVLNRHA